MELRRKAVYSVMNQKLKQVQELEEKELRSVIGYMMKDFQACSLVSSSSVRNRFHTLSCQSSDTTLLLYNELLQDLAALNKKYLSFHSFYISES